MKTISKLIALVAFMALFSTGLKAQTTPANALRLGIGVEISDPTGNARLGSHFSLGGTARLQYGITDDFAITLTSGAYHFFAIKIPGTDTRYNSYGVIPLKAGFKVFFAKSIYFGMEAGAGFEETDNGAGPTRLLLSPALGVANAHWDVALHYENFSGDGDKYGLIALRIAYGFKL